MITLSLDEVFDLSRDALVACGAADPNAVSVARSVREAEAEGIRNVGLGFMPYYCDHLLHGAIAGDAQPVVLDKSPAVVVVDGADGFAHPAYDAAEDILYTKARTCGLAALSVTNVYYNGVEGYFVNRIAERGLIGFACTNAASMVAPYGGNASFFGTNPLAFGVPRIDQAPLVIDLSTSTTAYVNVAAAAAEGRSIPDTWAFDSTGRATTNPDEGLAGSLQPLGGPKGTGLGLMVEILAAGLAGSHWSFEVPKFRADLDAPPRLGQFYMAIDPSYFGNRDLLSRLETMIAAMRSQDGVRLPGDNRLGARARAEKEGVELDETLFRSLQDYTRTGED